jgi:hypothetical protein
VISRPNIVPPPAISGGIPVPPFVQPKAAPRAEPKPTAQAQTIKVDVGEEIEQERKKSRSRIILGGIVGALIGAGIGFVAGGSKEKGDVAKAAADSAGKLKDEVKAANEAMTKLSQKLADAGTKLESKEFPTELAGELGALNVPFDSARLDKRNVGGMPNRIQSSLFKFTSGVEDVNKTKDSLRNILGLVQAPIAKAWAEEKEPKANYSILFRSEGQNKVVADLVPNKEPFTWKGDHPGNYTVTVLQAGKPAEKKAERWVKGDLVKSDPVVVPLDPKSMAGLVGDVGILRLRKAIYDLKIELEGNKEDPTSTGGLVKLGDDLLNDLHKFSLQK